MEILLYVTDCPERVLSGNPLALYMPNDDERQKTLEILAETLEANVLQMKNGDHMLIGKNKNN